MPDTNPSKPSARRRLLSALIAGGAGATTLPARWTRPVVDSVLLPAHAQTSPQDCVPLILDGCSVTCNDGIGVFPTLYTFDLVDGCPTIVTADESGPPPTSPNQILIVCIALLSVGRVHVEGFPAGNSVTGLKHCGSSLLPPPIQVAIPMEVGGVSFIATGTITVGVDGVEVSPIQVIPA